MTDHEPTIGPFALGCFLFFGLILLAFEECGNCAAAVVGG